MHKIIRKLWEQKLTLTKWANDHGFSQSYCSMVIHGKRGIRGSKKSEEIISSLKNEGFWVKPDEQTTTGGGRRMGNAYDICQERYDAMLPPWYEGCDEEEDVKNTQEEMMDIYLDTLECLAGMELENLTVYASFGVGENTAYNFRVTVFGKHKNKNKNSRSFMFYDWQSQDSVRFMAKTVISAISHDDFLAVKKLIF